MNYLRASDLLNRGRNGQKKLANNTYLKRISEHTIGVRLHNTFVVEIHDDGNYTLNDGGWQTVTTKARINEYSPARIYSKNGIWLIGDYVYESGMRIDSHGVPIGATVSQDTINRKKRALDRMVREYINGFAADAIANGGLKQPSNGDCWGCLFKTEGKGPHADQPLGVDHLISHFQEKYYVPSLLWKALHVKGYANPAFIWHMIDGEIKREEKDNLVRELSSYFRKLKPELLKYA